MLRRNLLLLTMMRFLDDPPRFLFFTGKGGVGKTSVACATAVTLAEQGRQVLLVSTDPASNVGQVLGVTIGNTITPIPDVPGLSALEIDPEQAAAAYRERIIAPVRGLLPDKEIASITEQLSGSCTTEVASFNEFTALLADEQVFGQYDHVIFDTAPTGHTIRLLQLPGSWTDFLNEGKGDASCLGPLAGLDKQRAVYADAVAALKDPDRTRLVLVTRAQESALAEVARTNDELAQIGIRATHLIVNGVLPEAAGEEDLATAVREREAAALAAMPAGLSGMQIDVIELKSANMIGLGALRLLLARDAEAGPPIAVSASSAEADFPAHHLGTLVDEIEQGGHGLVMCMGKGGVGKTTIAASIAVALAHRGHQVHLTTTDPAAHVEETLQGAVTGLRVTRIDPVEATREYRERIMSTKGRNLDDVGRAALHEDLLSPCTEEVAVFGQFSRVISEARHEFVVVDTAPTGHTLLLLDAAGSYHRDIVRQMGSGVGFRTPMMMLQDPEVTKVVLVTLPEPTPVTEARVLQDDLERAGIHPWAWVVNTSLAAAQPKSAFLRQRAAAEAEQITVVESLTDRVAIVPLLRQEPVGEARLAGMAAAQRIEDAVLGRLSLLDRFLPIWILLAMAGGLLLGRLVPGVQGALDSVRVGETSLPIAIGLLLMMYPVLAKVRYEEMGHVTGDRRLLWLSLLLNWVIGPLLMFVLAWVFLADQPAFRTGLIVIGLARCIAMVLIWNDLACGDGEAAALLVAINSLFQIVAYALLGTFYLAILPGWLGLDTQDVEFSTWDITKAVLIFLGIPLAAGYLTRRIGLRTKGKAWYEGTFLPRIGPFALYGLLFTIVVMFALQGDAILSDPGSVVRIAIPLLVYFAVMWGVAFFLGVRARLGYPKTATLAFTAAGNNFELAIAVSIGVWGVTSGQALTGVIGPLIEVPALVGLVYVSLWLRRRYFARLSRTADRTAS